MSSRNMMRMSKEEVEVYRDNKWQRVEYKDLLIGDFVRFHRDGQLLQDEKTGQIVFEVVEQSSSRSWILE